MSAFRVKLGANDLNYVDVLLTLLTQFIFEDSPDLE